MKSSLAIGSMLSLALFLYPGGRSRSAAADDKTAVAQLAQTIPLPSLTGGTNHLAADAKRGRFFVTSPGEKKVVVVDLKAGKELKVMNDVPAAASAFLPDVDQLCLSGSGGVAFFEGESLTPIGKLDLQSSVDEVQYDAKHKRLYVGLMDAKRPGVAVVDAGERKLLTKLKLPTKPQGFVIEENGPRIYANTPGAGQVTVLDRNQQSTVAEWKLTEAQSNYPIALDERHHRLFVACRRPARLVVIDTQSGKTVAQADTGGDADDMSFDPFKGLVQLACGDGVITTVRQIDADHYQRLANTPTTSGARNSLFVPELKTFYVAVPGRNGGGELRAYVAKD